MISPVKVWRRQKTIPPYHTIGDQQQRVLPQRRLAHRLIDAANQLFAGRHVVVRVLIGGGRAKQVKVGRVEKRVVGQRASSRVLCEIVKEAVVLKSNGGGLGGGEMGGSGVSQARTSKGDEAW